MYWLLSLCAFVRQPVSTFPSGMQQGVNDVLPTSAFDNLTAEDLHLLMNGSSVVDVEVLKKVTSFMDESHEGHMT